VAIDSTTPTRGGLRLRWWMTAGAALLLAVGALTSTRLIVNAAAIDLAQCNGGDGGGSAIACDITIVNNLNGSVTSSTVTVARYCAGTNVLCFNTPPTTTTSTNLVTAVHQCNNAGNGGGSTLTCTVHITNNITSSAGVTAATVNECVGSADGIGGAKVTCNPFPASTTGADVTQCNGSANGGTLVGLSCSVSTDSTRSAALPVSVNQCNGSDNGGGSKVTCRVFITNNVTAPATAPGATPSPAGSTPPGQTGTTGTTPGQTGTTGTTPGDTTTPGGGITTAAQPPLIGAPSTGGAAPQAGRLAGVLALLGSIFTCFILRARRTRMTAR
jgi:hypothetical protein